MRCPRCRAPMSEQRGTYHKKRKWICKRCGRTRMQSTRTSRKRSEAVS